jgi:type 1 glutamine amidotransferase
VRRTDGDFPLAWAKNYGKGRVFYSSLGHALKPGTTVMLR